MSEKSPPSGSGQPGTPYGPANPLQRPRYDAIPPREGVSTPGTPRIGGPIIPTTGEVVPPAGTEKGKGPGKEDKKEKDKKPKIKGPKKGIGQRIKDKLPGGKGPATPNFGGGAPKSKEGKRLTFGNVTKAVGTLALASTPFVITNNIRDTHDDRRGNEEESVIEDFRVPGGEDAFAEPKFTTFTAGTVVRTTPHKVDGALFDRTLDRSNVVTTLEGDEIIKTDAPILGPEGWVGFRLDEEEREGKASTEKIASEFVWVHDSERGKDTDVSASETVFGDAPVAVHIDRAGNVYADDDSISAILAVGSDMERSQSNVGDRQGNNDEEDIST